MYKMKRDGEETVIYTEAALGRHLEAGWVVEEDEASNVVTEINDEPKKRGPKPKNKETD